MTDEALWALGRGTGITALVFLTLALSLGIATRSGRPMLSLPRFAVADVHRFAALAGTALVAHPCGDAARRPLRTVAPRRLRRAVPRYLPPAVAGSGHSCVRRARCRHRHAVFFGIALGCAPSASCTGRPMHFGRSPSPMLSATGQASPNGGSCWSPGFCVVARRPPRVGWRLRSDYTEYRDVRIIGAAMTHSATCNRANPPAIPRLFSAGRSDS